VISFNTYRSRPGRRLVPGRLRPRNLAGVATPPSRPLTQPHPSRLPDGHPRRAEILDAHARALDAGQAGYTDPETGLFVLTAGYLAARGTCCGRGCRHCPYLD
jgi:Family of unknown function (DUF5522)